MSSRSAILLLFLAGCSVQRGEGRFLDQDLGAVDAAADGGPIQGDATLGDDLTAPAGTWMLFLEDATCLTALGQHKEQIIWTWYSVKVEDEGPGGADGERHLAERLRFCHQDVSPAVAGLQTYVPDLIPQHLPEEHLEAILLGPHPGDRYVTTELFETFGLKDIGESEPLPTTADDGRVVDQDADGHPGVTLELGNNLCDIYIVQRTRSRLTGTVRNAGLVDGTFWSTLDKVVLDATQPLCKTSNVVSTGDHPSRFVMVRVDGVGGAYDFDLDHDGDIDCDEIAQAHRFFAETGVAKPRDPDATACQP
jgi:hypothetical protein